MKVQGIEYEAGTDGTVELAGVVLTPDQVYEVVIELAQAAGLKLKATPRKLDKSRMEIGLPVTVLDLEANAQKFFGVPFAELREDQQKEIRRCSISEGPRQGVTTKAEFERRMYGGGSAAITQSM